MGGQLIHTLRDHLSRLQAQLQTDSTSIPHPLRVHDVATMDHTLTYTTHTDLELKLIDSVRLRLNVYCLSEITSVDGTTIRNKPFMGIPDQCYKPNPTPLRQDKPSTKAGKPWTTALTHLITTNRRLRLPLGKLTSHHSDRGKWQGCHTPHTSDMFTMFDDKQGKWVSHERTGTRL